MFSNTLAEAYELLEPHGAAWDQQLRADMQVGGLAQCPFPFTHLRGPSRGGARGRGVQAYHRHCGNLAGSISAMRRPATLVPQSSLPL